MQAVLEIPISRRGNACVRRSKVSVDTRLWLKRVPIPNSPQRPDSYMSDAPADVRSVDDLRNYIHKTLCAKENLLADQFRSDGNSVDAPRSSVWAAVPASRPAQRATGSGLGVGPQRHLLLRRMRRTLQEGSRKATPARRTQSGLIRQVGVPAIKVHPRFSGRTVCSVWAVWNCCCDLGASSDPVESRQSDVPSVRSVPARTISSRKKLAVRQAWLCEPTSCFRCLRNSEEANRRKRNAAAHGSFVVKRVLDVARSRRDFREDSGSIDAKLHSMLPRALA